MKRIIKSLTLVALFVSYCIPTWGQVSTEGRDFWAALIFGTAPDGKMTDQELFLAVSAKEKCSVTVSNPNTGWTKTYSVEANDWTPIKDIPVTQWWPGNKKADVNGKIMEKGLHVPSDKDISLFAGIRYEFSFDASIILPTHVLLSDYYVQDYPPYDHNDKTSWGTYSILATEAGETTVTITNPGATTANSPIKLKQGEVYYYVSGDKVSITGTHIVSDKPIAVYNGDVCTDVPGEISARDLTYEQAMPTDYWGTQFVVTRSLIKDANRIRITAMENDTKIFFEEDGPAVAKIDAGETFEFELSTGTGNTEKVKKTLSEKGLPLPLVVTGDAQYIKTSCPCAVYAYEVSEKYNNLYDDNSNPSEVIKYIKDNKEHYYGDPSMVWISPLEQHINKITFGVCPTSNIDLHNVNIVAKTIDVDKIRLTSKNNPDGIALNFLPVPGTDYSYARQQICNSADTETDVTKKDNVFTLYSSSPTGFIAHVYGNGKQESYAYSVGSSAVSLGTITIGDQVFQDGDVAKKSLCINEELHFDATAGTTIIDKVEWDFGDGVTETVDEASTFHKYTSPGWYDVKAKLYAHKDCPATTYPPFDVHFRFYVSRPDTIRHTISDCVDEDYTGEMVIFRTDTFGCDSIVINQVFLYRKSSSEKTVYGEDAYPFKDSIYTTSTDVYDTIPNPLQNGCDSVVTWHIIITKCLGMQFENKPEEQEICAGDGNLDIPFSYNRDGNHLNAYLCLVKHDPTAEWGYRLIDTTLIDVVEKGEEGDRKLALVNLPISEWAPGRYVGCILMEDANCKIIKDGVEVPAVEQSTALDITVKYPEDIMVFRFNNVLAVYQKGFGGNKGYDFVAYQWYLNGNEIDKQKNPSAATSIFHSEEIFTPGDEYYVMLTEKGKESVPSCSFFVPDNLDDYTPKQDDKTQDANPQASKKVINSRICVEFDGRTYDMYGQRVK